MTIHVQYSVQILTISTYAQDQLMAVLLYGIQWLKRLRKHWRNIRKWRLLYSSVNIVKINNNKFNKKCWSLFSLLASTGKLPHFMRCQEKGSYLGLCRQIKRQLDKVDLYCEQILESNINKFFLGRFQLLLNYFYKHIIFGELNKNRLRESKFTVKFKIFFF